MVLLVLAWILKLSGLVILLIGWFSAVREMFAEDRAWGYIGIAVPISALVFTFLRWDDLKRQGLFMMGGRGHAGGRDRPGAPDRTSLRDCRTVIR